MGYMVKPPALVLSQLNDTVTALKDKMPGGQDHIAELFSNKESACRSSLPAI